VVLQRAGMRPLAGATGNSLWTVGSDGEVYPTSRAHEIADFLSTRHFIERPKAWAVLDDQDHNWELLACATCREIESWLVKTDSKVGITQAHVDRAVEILGRRD
jgi:hypothetical protein